MPETPLDAERALTRLLDDGFLRRDGNALRTTARFQAALARSAYALQRANAPWHDLRLPIAGALAGYYQTVSDEALATLVEVMLSVEERALEPLTRSAVTTGR